MAKAIAQYTITDFNDVNIATTAPTSPVTNMLWLDTSVVPNQLKRYSGSSWVVVNDVSTITQRVSTAESNITQMNTKISLKVEQSTLETSLADVNTNIDSAVKGINNSLINKAENADLIALTTKVNTNYTDLTSTADSISATVGTITETITEQGKNINEVKTYFNFKANGLGIGKSDSPLNINISNEQMDFIDNGNVVAYINGQKMFISSLEVLTSLIVGSHQIEKYNSNITLVKYIGGN